MWTSPLTYYSRGKYWHLLFTNAAILVLKLVKIVPSSIELQRFAHKLREEIREKVITTSLNIITKLSCSDSLTQDIVREFRQYYKKVDLNSFIELLLND